MTRHRVAVVHGPRGVHFVAVADSVEALDLEVATYVRRQAPGRLAPWTRERVLCLLERGDVRTAVDVYFQAVGVEWEAEWLYRTEVAAAGNLASGRVHLV